jgi:hypothetical protein
MTVGGTGYGLKVSGVRSFGVRTTKERGRMKYEKPEVLDFGSIGDHTFTTPGGQVKGGRPPSKPDEHGELSHEETGGS